MSKKVPAEGPRDARIMIVGESPGANEVREGRPFVGLSGEKLNDFLGRVGIKRSECYITNACKYYPTGDKEKFFFASPNMPSDLFFEGMEELKKDIQNIRPNVVVAMGNYALWALTLETGIAKRRGSIMECKLVRGIKVIPTLHPAYILRQWDQYPLIVWDLQRVREESAYPDIRLPESNYIIFPTQGDIDRAVERLLKADVITIDTEWFTPDSLACIGFTDSSDWAICIPADFAGAIPAYRALLQSNARKVFQNAIFDCVYLERAGLPVKCEDDEGNRLVEDTMVAHYFTWPMLKKGLDTITSIYTKEPYYKDEYKISTSGPKVDLEMYYLYNCKDVRVTHEAWLALQDEMREFHTRKAYELSMKFFLPMRRASVTGIKCDYEMLQQLKEKHLTKAEMLREELSGFVGYDFNPRSPKQVAELVYDKLGLPTRAKRTTEQKVLMDIAAQLSTKPGKHLELAILKGIIFAREASNMVSKYINDTLPDEDGRIRSGWHPCTKNGRLGAGKDKFKGRGAALNTLPYEARKLCVADEGYIFVKPDLAQAEARVVAYLAEDWTFIDWIEEGLDTHCKLAEMIFGETYEVLRKRHKENKGDQIRERFLAKTCKHGTNYRMGPETLKLTVNEEFHKTGFGITQAEAKEIINKILSIHSALPVWWKQIEKELDSRMWLENPFGRRRIFTDRWGDTMIKDAIAFKPQSTVTDINKIGLERVRHYLRREFGDDPYVTVLVDAHDGSLIQVPEGITHDHLSCIVQLLTVPVRIGSHEVVIPVDIATGYSWGTMKEVELARVV